MNKVAKNNLYESSLSPLSHVNLRDERAFLRRGDKDTKRLQMSPVEMIKTVEEESQTGHKAPKRMQ